MGPTILTNQQPKLPLPDQSAPLVPVYYRSPWSNGRSSSRASLCKSHLAAFDAAAVPATKVEFGGTSEEEELEIS